MKNSRAIGTQVGTPLTDCHHNPEAVTAVTAQGDNVAVNQTVDDQMTVGGHRTHFSGGRLKARREQLGLSQEDLAKRVRYTRAHISAVERGFGAPSIRFLDRVTAALDIDVVDLWV